MADPRRRSIYPLAAFGENWEPPESATSGQSRVARRPAASCCIADLMATRVAGLISTANAKPALGMMFSRSRHRPIRHRLALYVLLVRTSYFLCAQIGYPKLHQLLIREGRHRSPLFHAALP